MTETYSSHSHIDTTAHTSSDQKQLLHKKTKQNKTKKVVSSLLGLIIFFILTTIFSQYQVYVLQKIATAKEEKNPDVPVTNEEIVRAVGRHLMLPEDGAPQIAEVKDAAKLKSSQAFFKDAVNGDYVIVYNSTIILYRPLEDILVSVGSVEGELK